MGKKTKIGKDRKDKFYKLAKETGFRSRAAFKLIQLNRRFGFLQQSQVCVDLCAAPGGWMQVARQNMPVSSIVIGVDLFPIKPIAGCLSLTEDITTDKCRQSLQKELKTWKVDVVLNDGAPNVGKNWIFDAYQQICLALSAAKLSTELLRPNGWFITKVFRSKDYNALIWVLKQLFKKVYATKPSASRKESAEIFVVCQGYKAPTKIDPKFLDPKYVFEELEIENTKKIDLLKEPKSEKKAKAVGYDSVDVRKIYTATEFLQAESALDILQFATQINVDDPKIASHPATTSELVECFKDVKVLNRRDLKEIIKWWKVVKDALYPKKSDELESTLEAPKKLTEDEEAEQELAEIDKHIEELKMEENREERRKKKKANKERSKLEQKLSLKMIIKGDEGPHETHDEEVFNLNEIKNKKVMEKLLDGVDITKKRERNKKKDPKMVAYEQEDMHHDVAHLPTINSDVEDGDDSDEFEEELGIVNSASEAESDDDDHEQNNWKVRPKNASKGNAKEKRGGVTEKGRNPLITDLDYRDKDTKRNAKAAMWFEKDVFKEMQVNEEKDEDFDLDTMVKQYKQKGIKIQGEDEKVKPDLSQLGKKARRRARYQEETENGKESSDESADEGIDVPPMDSEEADADDDKKKEPKKKKIKLNEEELALGELIVTSQKMKRNIADAGWNRYMFNDEDLPDWFVDDEKKHMQKGLPVTEELVEKYRKNTQEINTRSIKKVMEAKARKKRRAKKQLEKVKKKAEVILENADHSGQEKIKMLKKLYKKTEKKKEEVTYVVAKKGHSTGKNVRRPAGVKGRFKVVDPRLKKDMRAENKSMKGKRGGKAGGKSKMSGGGKGGKGKMSGGNKAKAGGGKGGRSKHKGK